MAIQFARVRILQRTKGHNVVRTIAYNSRNASIISRYHDKTTGMSFDYRHKGGAEHHEVLLPEGGWSGFLDAEVFANAIEKAERRYDAQLGREFVLALPNDAGISKEDRIDLARSFVEKHFVDKGLPVHLALHREHDEDNNPHAHVVVAGRRLEGDRLSAHKARDLNPPIRPTKERGFMVMETERWGELWRDHQNEWFREHDRDISVDILAPVPQRHIDPVRFESPAKPYLLQANAERHYANAELLRDADRALEYLERSGQPFDGKALEKFLSKHLRDPEERREVQQRIAERQAERNEPPAALYERYKAERAAMVAARKDAESAVYQQFAEHHADMRSWFQLRHEQEKLQPRPGLERHNAHELLRAQSRGSRVEQQQARARALAAARQRHPVLSYEKWLEREVAERGSPEAARILQQQRERDSGLER